MNDDFLPFSKPSISQAAIDDVVACLQSGWITTGPKVLQFTEALSAYLKAPYVLPLSSATAGLHLSLLALDLSEGDEVITTPMTFAATINAIVLAGAKPVLVDIDPETLHLDLNQVESAITDKTRLILPVHFAGLPLDMEALYDLAESNHLRVIEDAAHAMGASFQDQVIGSLGDIQVFSFHPTKNMTTGEGGCISTRDEALAKKISLLRFHGIDREAWNRYAKGGKQDYDIVMPGYKHNMMDIQAAIGLHQLAELDEFVLRRQVLANRYQEALSDWPEWELPKRPGYDHQHAWHIYTPLLNTDIAGMNRDEFMLRMKEKNIGTGLHYRAVHLFPFYQAEFGFRKGDFPYAENVSERIVSLPLFPSMSDADQDRVIDVMYSIFNP